MWLTRPAAARAERHGELVPARGRGGTRRRGRRRAQPRRPARARRPLGPGRRARPGTTRPARSPPWNCDTAHAARRSSGPLGRQRVTRARHRVGADPRGRPRTAATCGWSCTTEPSRVGVVHVRDTLTAAPDTTAARADAPGAHAAADTPVHAALSTMRERRNHLVLVHADGELARAGHPARPARPATTRRRRPRLTG